MEVLTNPDEEKLDKETLNTWWDNDKFTEKDLHTYKEILKKTYSIYQNNDPSSKAPKSSKSEKWKKLVSQIWKEVKTFKFGTCLTKQYHEGPIEYKYIDNLNQLMQRLYFIYAEEKAGNNNFHNEKRGIVNFFTDQFENIIDTPKSTEYIIRFVSCLPKGLFKTGSGVLNTLLNKFNNVMPEMHLPGYNYCGPFTKLEERLAIGDKPINKLDAGCQQHDIFYRNHRDTKERHGADEVLENIAKERMHASDASFGEKVNSALVRTIMNSKVAFGMGLKY